MFASNQLQIVFDSGSGPAAYAPFQRALLKYLFCIVRVLQCTGIDIRARSHWQAGSASEQYALRPVNLDLKKLSLG